MRFVRGLLLAMICITGTPVLGEEIWYPKGQRPIMATSEKIQRSLEKALWVAEGSFTEITPGHSLEALDGTRSSLSVMFKIKRLLKGSHPPFESTVQLNLVVYRPLPAVNNNIDGAALAMSRNTERAFSGKMVAFDEYLSALGSARAPLLKSSNYLKEYFIVPVVVGSLDVPYRLSDVVVQLRKTYLIFVMRDLSSTGELTLFPADLDIYDVDDADAIAISMQVPRRPM